jgi:hypothetical protein
MKAPGTLESRGSLRSSLRSGACVAGVPRALRPLSVPPTADRYNDSDRYHYRYRDR